MGNLKKIREEILRINFEKGLGYYPESKFKGWVHKALISYAKYYHRKKSEESLMTSPVHFGRWLLKNAEMTVTDQALYCWKYNGEEIDTAQLYLKFINEIEKGYSMSKLTKFMLSYLFVIGVVYIIMSYYSWDVHYSSWSVGVRNTYLLFMIILAASLTTLYLKPKDDEQD